MFEPEADYYLKTLKNCPRKAGLTLAGINEQNHNLFHNNSALIFLLCYQIVAILIRLSGH